MAWNGVPPRKVPERRTISCMQCIHKDMICEICGARVPKAKLEEHFSSEHPRIPPAKRSWREDCKFTVEPFSFPKDTMVVEIMPAVYKGKNKIKDGVKAVLGTPKYVERFCEHLRKCIEGQKDWTDSEKRQALRELDFKEEEWTKEAEYLSAYRRVRPKTIHGSHDWGWAR